MSWWSAPPPIDEGLRSLPGYDRKRIAEAVTADNLGLSAPDDIEIETADSAPVEGGGILAELLVHRAMMVNVSRGGPRIPEVDDYYKARESRLKKAVWPCVFL